MAGQAGYHLLTQARVAHAPWPVTTIVSCLPVLVLGMGATLAHLLRADAHNAPGPDGHPGAGQLVRSDHARQDRAVGPIRPDLQDQAQAAARRLAATGQRVSRRALRAAGVRGSNASLGELARTLSAGP